MLMRVSLWRLAASIVVADFETALAAEMRLLRSHGKTLIREDLRLAKRQHQLWPIVVRGVDCRPYLVKGEPVVRGWCQERFQPAC